MPKLMLIVIAAAVLAVPAAAGAQTSSSTTSTSTSTTTTTPPLLPGQPEEEPPQSTTTTVPPEEDHAREEGAVPEEPPEEEVEVPEAEEETTPGGVVRNIRHELVRQQQAAMLAAIASQAQLGTAYHQLASLRALEERLESQLLDERLAERRAAGGAAVAKEQFRERAVNAYVEGPGQLSFILSARDPNELLHRTALTTSVLSADRDGWIQARDRHRELDGEVEALVTRLAEVRTELGVARQDVAALSRHADHQRGLLRMFEAGSQIAIAGFVFPVGDPHHFVDTFGAPRMVGTEYEHAHQGTDIFAPMGTDLYAVERGVITRVGTDVLGGTKLWLTGASGVRYYYAHLSGYAEGIVEGTLVEAGQLVGYVGNTGNARSTPPHVHFEVHPRQDFAVNPYPILAVTDTFRGTYEDFA